MGFALQRLLIATQTVFRVFIWKKQIPLIQNYSSVKPRFNLWILLTNYTNFQEGSSPVCEAADLDEVDIIVVVVPGQ